MPGELHKGYKRGFPGGASLKNLSANAGDIRDAGWLPGSGRSPWGRAWQPSPVFLPGESVRQRSLWATVHRAAKSWTRLERLSTQAPRTIYKEEGRASLVAQWRGIRLPVQETRVRSLV